MVYWKSKSVVYFMVTYKKMLHGILEIQERGILHGNIQENLMKKNINSSKKNKTNKTNKTNKNKK